MTNLRFVGEFPLWLGLLLSLIVCVLSWRYYLQESFDLPDRLRWVLPLLRSLAFLLGILILTGPVLHHRSVIGELGHVKIYVDASQSMGLLDRHISDGRKLLIAQQQGWLEPDRIDASGLDRANLLTNARVKASAVLQQQQLSAQQVADVRDNLAAAITAAGSATAQPTADFAGDVGLNELSQQLSGDGVTIEQLESVCNALPILEQNLRQAFEADIQRLVAGDNDSIRTALTMFDEASRWRRAKRTLLETKDALFSKLRTTHDVEILALQNDHAVKLLSGVGDDAENAEYSESPDSATSDLSSGITASQQVSMARESDGEDDGESTELVSDKANTAVVLLTDGQHNSGPSPLQTARVLGSQGIPFYPVSLGATQQAPDIAITGIEHPEMVFQQDRVRGTMVVRDRMPSGLPMVAEVSYEGEVLWQEQLLSDNSGERRIEFEFGIEELVNSIGSQFDSGVKRHAVPLAMTASIAPMENETETQNNQLPLRLAAITQSYRLLIIDGRSRWETRYLRNAFERDNQWDVDVIIAGPGNDNETLPRGDGDDMFPENRDGLFGYDLVIFGEIPLDLFAEHEFKWLREFVEIRGGGMIFVDGTRHRMQAFSTDNLGPLLPVEWQSEDLVTLPTMLQLTDKGSHTAALTFETDVTANQQFWTELPPPHRVNNVTALPGAEVLVEAVIDGRPTAAMVTRSYGAGRVLYLASDETWRWRYKAADSYHQRIWNQLATYVMPRPFATSDEYLSVDTGPVSYQNGDSASIRIRLMGLDGKPATDATVDALVWKNGRTVSTVSLIADPDVPGIYRGESGELSEGDYEVSVQASGFSQEALKARGQFVVLPPESAELANTTCNEALLQQMAAESGGVYLREEQVNQLAGLLSPLSSGRVVESDTLLWQSYWWFAAIIFLLTMEWFLRKRAGLL